MKRIMTTLAVMVMIVTSAAAMSFSKARKEALFLSDKMAYELGLSISQYEAVYEINLDYFLGLYDPVDLDGVFWLRRNADLRYVLSEWQWLKYTSIVDFYRPMSWVRRHTFSLVLRSRYTTNYFFYDRPTIYYNFRGGHNVGHDSYYAGREFHRPPQPGAQMHFGSSAPPAYGTVKPNSKSYPSYHIGEAAPATTTHGTSRSGSTTVNANTAKTNASQNVAVPATTPSRPQTFGGSQRGNSSTTRSTQPTSAVPQRTTTTQRSATTTATPTTAPTTAPQRSATSSTSTSGSTRGNSGSTRGNSGGSRGR